MGVWPWTSLQVPVLQLRGQFGALLEMALQVCAEKKQRRFG